MGFDLTRFQDEVDEELLCSVCGQVLENPIQLAPCEHCFCAECIREWLRHQQTCPIDRQMISDADVVKAPRIVRNLIGRLNVSCDNKDFGCESVVRIDSLENHLSECPHNPKRPVQCDKGCGLVIPFDEVPQHNCTRETLRLLKEESKKVEQMSSKLEEQERVIINLQQEILVVKEIIRGLRIQGMAQGIGGGEDIDRAIQTARWLTGLKPAKVRRWGGMISTPDNILQAIIKRALTDNGCPPYLVTELMANSHERKWPPGLSTLETRQSNRRKYEHYISRRIQGKQAIVIMACENEHMGESMIASPGIVMIFAHGIE